MTATAYTTAIAAYDKAGYALDAACRVVDALNKRPGASSASIREAQRAYSLAALDFENASEALRSAIWPDRVA